VDDGQIVAGVLRGDREAVAAMYDTYADVLHDYARRRAPTEADAADVVHDAFLVAVQRIGQLRDPQRLRPWLYAITRTELHRRYRQAARHVELGTGADWREPVSQQPGPDVLAERAELAALLREAAAGLTGSDRELLDLHLRHGLVGADLAAAAGLPARHAAVALERVKGRLARTLGVVLLSRRPACPEFEAIRDAQPGLTPLARKRLARHVDGCAACRLEQERRLRPEVLLAAVPMLAAPPQLRHRLVAAAGDPTCSERREAARAGGRWRWDRDGFPAPPARRRNRPVWAAAAAVLLIGGVLAARPLIGDRPVAVDGIATPRSAQTGPARTAHPPTTTDTAGPPSSAPPSGPTTSPTTAGPTTTTRTTSTRRTTTTTSTPPPDTTPPVIGPATLDRQPISATYKSNPTCTQYPATATVTATVTDASGVAGVSVSWSSPAGTGGTVTMKPVTGGYVATIGPVATDTTNPPFGSYVLTISVAATDKAGNQASRVTTLDKGVAHCGIG
jgi:RNA polymerase sigma factor (sigma-70 family)